MIIKELEQIRSAAELRNPGVYNASRERYVVELSMTAGFKAGYAQALTDASEKLARLFSERLDK